MNKNATLRKSSARQADRTDWARIARMSDQEIDTSDSPELGTGFFANAVAIEGPIREADLGSALGIGVCKQQITLRVDSDVIEFFKKKGKGYQRMMNFALRAYMWRERQAEGKTSARTRKLRPRSAGK